MTISELKSRLQKSIDYLNQELTQIRTGRAVPALIENIVMDAYGSKMTLKEVGSITVLDSQNLLVSPWDKSLLQGVASAIRESELQVSPVVDGTQVRVPIPALTEERRRDFTKLVAQKVEETKISLRNTRQEAMKDIERDFTDKKISEDEKFTQKTVVEDTVKEFVQKSDEIGEAKKEDLMRV